MKVLSKEEQSAYFDNISHQYSVFKIQNVPPHVSYEHNAIINVIRKTYSGGRILDFGAGSGRLTFALISSGYNVDALDPSRKSLDNLADQAQKMKIPVNTYALYETFPADTYYEYILGTDILHHISIDEYAKTFYSNLLPGGHVVFSEPGAWNVAWHIFLRLLHSWDIEKGIMQITVPNLMKQFKSAGFTKVHVIGLALLPMPLFNFFPLLHRLNQMLSNVPLLKYFAYRFLVAAEK